MAVSMKGSGHRVYGMQRWLQAGKSFAYEDDMGSVESWPSWICEKRIGAVPVLVFSSDAMFVRYS
jgi:hypothetical protein